MIKKLLPLLILFVSFIAVANIFGKGWMIYHEGAFKGRVIDGQTKEPIEGAVVVAVYHTRKYGIGAGISSNATPVDAKEVLTKKNGDFYIRPHLFTSCWPFAHNETTEFIVYKPGYTEFLGWDYGKYFPAYPIRSVNTQLVAEQFRKGITVELAKLQTWEERNRANMISISDLSKRLFPLLTEMIDKEEVWLNQNKSWRRE